MNHRSNHSAVRTVTQAAVAFLLCLLAGPGCTTTTISTGTGQGGLSSTARDTIAVVPFENLSHSRNAGLILTDLASSLMYSQGHYSVVEVSSLGDDQATRFRRFEITPWERQLGINTASAAAIGRALKTDWVLVGSVGEYGFVDGFGETANIGGNLRLVRVEDESVVWASAFSRRAATSAFNEESVHRLAHEVLRDQLARMVQETAGASRNTGRQTK